jgi:antitoxin component YwqK of YwqJK toxin-antitoxin module
MKYFLFVILIFSFCACALKQEQVIGKLVVYKKFYNNNQLMEYREFRNDMKNGKQITYWDNGNKRLEYWAKNDVCEGELKEWDYNGNLFHLAHYKDGQEEGVQKMWYENGKIRANYVILEGKRFGLLGTKNCKNVSDSVFVVNQ